MIKITYEFATADEAITFLAKNRAGEVAAPAAAPKPDGAKAEKAAKAAAAPAPTATAAPAAAPATPPKESSTQVGYGIVADKIATAAKTHRAEVVALLGKYGAKSGKELKAEQYAEFVAEIDKITTPADDLA